MCPSSKPTPKPKKIKIAKKTQKTAEPTAKYCSPDVKRFGGKPPATAEPTARFCSPDVKRFGGKPPKTEPTADFCGPRNK